MPGFKKVDIELTPKRMPLKSQLFPIGIMIRWKIAKFAIKSLQKLLSLC